MLKMGRETIVFERQTQHHPHLILNIRNWNKVKGETIKVVEENMNFLWSENRGLLK